MSRKRLASVVGVGVFVLLVGVLGRRQNEADVPEDWLDE